MEYTAGFAQMPDGGYPQSGMESRKRPGDAGGLPNSKRDLLENGPSFLKLLVAPTTAGSLIGKAGSVMKELEAQYSIGMKLSETRCFFPGTQERVLLVAGQPESLRYAVPAILARGYEEILATEGEQLQIKLLATNPVCGHIIGKAGAESKALQAECGVRLSIGEHNPSVGERVCHLTGTHDAVCRAIQKLQQKFDEGGCNKEVNYAGGNFDFGFDKGNSKGKGKGKPSQGPPAHYQQHHEQPQQHHVQMHQPMGKGMPPAPHGKGFEHPPQQQGVVSQTPMDCEIEFSVEDAFVGSFIGKGGSVLKRIQAESGARIRLSDKGDATVGAGLRRVYIHGAVQSVHAAHHELLSIKCGEESRMQQKGGHY